MGLLDDAIREHLELKRLRGADPSDVIRQEREALGASAHLDPPEEPVDAQSGEAPSDMPVDGPTESLRVADADPGGLADDLWSDEPRPEPEPEPGVVHPVRDREQVAAQETAEVDMSQMLDMEEAEGTGTLAELPERPADEGAPQHEGGEASWGGEPAWGDPALGREEDDGGRDSPGATA